MPADPATAASPWTVTAAAPGRGEPNYDAIYAAVVSTAEGRWFLSQYASRNRNADTAVVLAAIDRLETEVGRERRPPTAPAPDPPPGPDIARLRRDLGELADALMYARSDIAAIELPGASTGRPRILAATEALQALTWFMRERGIEPLDCDRIDGCVGDIRAVCAIPDLTAERIDAIADVLTGLESRLHAIRTAIADGTEGANQFGDPRPLPAPNARTRAAAKPAAIEVKPVDAGIAAFTSGAADELEPPVACSGTEICAPAGAETTATAAQLSAAEFDRYLDARPPAADAAGAPTSPRLSHLLMAAELDRLLDAQAATVSTTSDPPPAEPIAVPTAVEAPAPVEAAAPFETAPSGEVTAPIEATTPEAAMPVERAMPVKAAMPAEATAPVEAVAIEVAQAPLEREPPTMPAAPPPSPPRRRAAAIAKDMFADVMALSEEERIALFT
jgi:hypothetical protein